MESANLRLVTQCLNQYVTARHKFCSLSLETRWRRMVITSLPSLTSLPSEKLAALGIHIPKGWVDAITLYCGIRVRVPAGAIANSWLCDSLWTREVQS
jgi:hypothetical protein